MFQASLGYGHKPRFEENKDKSISPLVCDAKQNGKMIASSLI